MMIIIESNRPGSHPDQDIYGANHHVNDDRDDQDCVQDHNDDDQCMAI